MRKAGIKIKILFAALLAVVLTAGSFPAYADQVGSAETSEAAATSTSDTSGSVTPRVTFTNTDSNSPDLYITKQVITRDGYTAPADAEFTFSIKVDGKFYSKEKYTLYNADGTEVSNKDASGVNLTRKTDTSGTFTLKAGQTAKFEYIGNGVHYQVTELSMPDHFRSSDPANGVMEGTMTQKSQNCVFVNEYAPETDSDRTELVVEKDVIMPQGYELPEIQNFIFTLTLDGKAYAEQQYTVTDLNGKNMGSGKTDSEGKFQLQAKQQAHFRDVETNLDYEVTETEPDSDHTWQLSSSTGTKGSTSAPLTKAVFVNRKASFAVTKSMSGEVSESDKNKEFSFAITDKDGKPYKNLFYWLYAVNENVTVKTETDGNFQLKVGETAIFYGIPEGTFFGVKEVKDSDYIQTTPENPEGYQNQMVTDSVPVLQFVNEKDNTPALRITKNVSVESDSAAPNSADEFTFILKKLNSDNNEYQAVGGMQYTVQTGTSESNYKTDKDGKFHIYAGQTAVFANPDAGEYTIEETDLPIGYYVKNTDTDLVKTATVKTGESTNVVFTNYYTAPSLDIKINKVGLSGTALPGAGFTLYRDEAMTNKVTKEVKTNDAGETTFSNVVPGDYWLKETTAPSGYTMSDAVFHVNISSSGSTYKVTAKRMGSGVLSNTAVDSDKEIPVDKDNTSGKATINLKVTDSKLQILPRTGGIGIWILLLIAAGAAIVGICLNVTGRKKFTGNKKVTR